MIGSVELTPTSTAEHPDDRRSALSAPVADPLWMLARHIQTGGHLGDDAGSPVQVRVSYQVAPISLDGHEDLLQAELEAEPTPVGDQVDTATRARAGARLLHLLRAAGLGRKLVRSWQAGLAERFPLGAVHPGGQAAVHAGRIPDGAALHSWLTANGWSPTTAAALPDLSAGPMLDPAQLVIAGSVIRDWLAATAGRLGAGTAGPAAQPRYWDPVHLGYQAQARAGGLNLVAARYDGAGLDWHSFDVSGSLDQAAPVVTVDARPAPVRYSGMPEPRFWALENGAVNLDLLAAAGPAQALLRTFAHAYANDWFLIPLDLPPGVSLITGVEVVDTFGVPTTVASTSAVDGPGGPWQLWEPSSAEGSPGAAVPGLRVGLPIAGSPLTGPIREDLLVVRDEFANLAWIVEGIVEDEDGRAVDRAARWLAQRPATDPAFEPSLRDDAEHYRLGTSVPDHWYPLTAEDVTGVRLLRLGVLPPGASDGAVEDPGALLGRLFPSGAGTRIADEEAARAGTRLTRRDRLAHIGDRTLRWTARVRESGRGDASAGLRFDLLGGPAIGAQLIANPEFARGRRHRPGPVTGAATGGPAAALAWEVWNNAEVSTATELLPTGRPGGSGWMLRVITAGAGCGIAQQWATNGTGPTSAEARCWVFVVVGAVTLGCGDGGSTSTVARSTTTGRWEELVVTNVSSPVNEVVLYAATSGGEFLVDSVTVRPVRTGP